MDVTALVRDYPSLPARLAAMEQDKLPPRDRIDTLPPGLPEYTLGWGVIAWVMENIVQPDGPEAGEPFTFTPRQAHFVLWFYAVDDQGHWLFNRGVRRLAKGSGKSPFAAVLCIVELLGPVKFSHFDPRLARVGGCVGVPVPHPLVQLAATSKAQTANTMRRVLMMCNRRSALAKKYGLFAGKTFIETRSGGRLEQISSSAASAEGAEASFVVADETEHWTPGRGGPDLEQTLTQNLDKTGSRMLETSNAWLPGEGSVAESTFEAWATQAEKDWQGQGRAGILYDATMAPHNTVLHDKPKEGELGLSDALRFVYDDCHWIGERGVTTFRDRIWAPNYAPSRAWRFFLNRPNAADTSWVSTPEWALLADPDREVEDGEDIVMFFDGSKSKDNSALVGCCLSDGHIFTIGVWEPQEHVGMVDVAEIDETVKEASERYNVLAFYADVQEWQSYVYDAWPAYFAESIVLPASKDGLIAWDMRGKTHIFATYAERVQDEVRERLFTHDADPVTSRHVANARVYETKFGRFSIRKESPKSPNKIDAAICVIGARMLYHLVRESEDYYEADSSGDGMGFAVMSW